MIGSDQKGFEIKMFSLTRHISNHHRKLIRVGMGARKEVPPLASSVRKRGEVEGNARDGETGDERESFGWLVGFVGG